MKNVIETLQARGFIDAMTSQELQKITSLPLKIYVGFDPTADSLHLGNLVGIIALSWFQKFGHTPFVLLGGATGRIGDPSGKSMERPLLDLEILDQNIASIRAFFEKILNPQEGPKPVILNNYDWFSQFSLIDFLRDIGKHFRVGSMIAKESVKARLQSEEGISFTEFSYQIFQAFDFYYLNQKYGVSIQMGGSDQWGNITAGCELNRKLGGEPIYGFTFPLITRSDGKKFGKSEEGAIWLSAQKLSPYHFYQYLFSMPDADVIRLLKMLTFLSLEEIESIENEMKKKDAIPNFAQKKLAMEVTRFVHGEEGLQTALKVTEGILPGSSAKLDSQILENLSQDMLCVHLKVDEVIGQKYVDMVVKIGLLGSKSEAVRLIKNGGAYLNNERIEDPLFIFSRTDLIDEKFMLLSAGKKKKILIRISGYTETT